MAEISKQEALEFAGLDNETPDLKDFDFEMDSTEVTLCGRLNRKHRMKRIHHSKTICIYPGCNGYC